MAINDVQLKDANGNWNSLFPISVAHGGTGATNAVAACKSIDAVRYDSTSSTSKVTDAIISAKSDSDQPIRISVTSAAGDYLVYFTKDGTIGLWDSNQSKTLWSIRFPVGYVYISYSSTSPATLFGGTWTEIKGYFLYANHGTGTGGENTHKLTVNEIPSHNHAHDSSKRSGFSGILALSGSAAGSTSFWKSVVNGGTANMWISTCTNVGTTGGGAAHENMPKYQTVYAWRRTA